MKKLLIILAGALLIFSAIIAINPPHITFNDSKVVPPERPASVPDKAFWVGGVDGGNFILIKKQSGDNKLFFVKIFNDSTGDIEYKGLLKYSGQKDTQELLDNPALYQGWDGDNLHLVGGERMEIFGDKSDEK